MLIILSLTGLLIFAGEKMNNEKSIKINDTEIKVAIADTPLKQGRGLGGKQSLKPDEGMLFVFSNYQIRSFWMKDMQFGIDIIWIRNNQIVGIEKNVPLADSQNLKSYLSPIPVNYVLEVNAGFCDGHNIKTGDRVDFDL